MVDTPKKLKRAVIKEELVALTGDFTKAVILQQFIYWSERVNDFDQFMLEEMKRSREIGQESAIELTGGWIYKKAEELAEETMLSLSKSNMLKHISCLVTAGWINQRRNPRNKMDKTYQYRVDLNKVQFDLLLHGYSLQDYTVPLDFIVEAAAKFRSSKTELRGSEMKLRSDESKLGGTEIELTGSESELVGSDTKPLSSDMKQQYQRLHTEITSQEHRIKELMRNNPEIFQMHLELMNRLSRTLSKPAYDTWIAPAVLMEVDLETGTASIYAHNEFAKDWLQQRYKIIICETLTSILSKNITQLHVLI